MEAMRIAVESLSIMPSIVLVDGPKLPGFNGLFPSLKMQAHAIIKGDSKSYSIAAAR